MGLRQIVTKSGQDTYSCFQQLLSYIEEVSKSSTNDTAIRLLLGISCTMSDRAATEHKFHLLLEEARAELLPQLYENWNDLNQSEQVEVGRLLNFFVVCTH